MRAATAATSTGTARFSRRVVLIALALAGLLIVAGAGLAAFRYLPALDEARALRTDLERTAERAQGAGLALDRATLDALEGDLASATTRLDTLRGFLANDPLLAVARAFPLTSADVRGADGIVVASGDVIAAAGDGLAIGRRFVDIREAQAADPNNASALSQLVELMATSRDQAVAASTALTSAHQTLAAIPDGLIAQVEDVRDEMSARLERYGPILDSYLSASTRLPEILGWDGPRRYLVLTQDPAELRPTGGFIGSYGIVAFDRGRMTEHSFRNVVPLDFPWDYPAIKPPQDLADYLLGASQPWQFADANWSPDFPSSAQDAIRLYANESGDTAIDGVLGVTTYTIDELLKVTGPITVPAYRATIASGETTLKVLQLTRAPSAPGVDQKAFLPAFADRLLSSLLALSPQKWGDVLGTAEPLGRDRLLLAWFRDRADEELATQSGFSGAVRQDLGDFVFPVDSNVAPATKLNAWTTKSMDLSVQIDPVGNARDTLAVTWDNQVDTPEGAPYRAMTNVGGHILGMYFRLLVPQQSRVEEVSGGGLAPVTDPAVVEEEAGRLAIGTYLKIPPGPTTLRTTWTSPYAASVDATGGAYRLTIQKQSGLVPGPLTVSIRVPDGLRVIAASPELQVSGGVASLTTTFDHDIVVGLQYGR